MCIILADRMIILKYHLHACYCVAAYCPDSVFPTLCSDSVIRLCVHTLRIPETAVPASGKHKDGKTHEWKATRAKAMDNR